MTDLERSEIQFQSSVTLATHSRTLQRSYREVDQPRHAPLAEAEERLLRIRRNTESPRHVGVLTIERSRAGEHHVRVVAGKKLHRCYRQHRWCRKDSRLVLVCCDLRHQRGFEIAAAIRRHCKLKCMRPLLLSAGCFELGTRA